MLEFILQLNQKCNDIDKARGDLIAIAQTQSKYISFVDVQAVNLTY